MGGHGLVAGHNERMHPYATEAPTKSPLRRFIGGTVLVAVIALLLLHAVGGWLISSWIDTDVLSAETDLEVDDGAVIGVESDRVVLRPAAGADDDVADAGVVGFQTDRSYLRLGEVIAVTDGDVVRTFEILDGAEPALGSFGNVDRTAQPASRLAVDLGLRETTYASPLGPMETWDVGSGDTWIIHVHDHTTGPDQALRMMAILADESLSQRSITYRNDDGQPAGPDGRFTYGVDERDDLAAAVADARQSGASRIVLAGYGSGASIVLAEMYRDLDIAGAILDSPVLDAESAVRYQAAQRQGGIIGALPSTVSATGAVLASIRYGVTWDTVDYLSRADQVVAPVLILHGGADSLHPIEDSRTLVDMRPGLVRLVEIEGAEADLAWNVDPTRYEMAVLDFLADIRSG